MQAIAWAFCLALLKAGNSIAARMAMMAITTSNSIKVKALPRNLDLPLEANAVSRSFSEPALSLCLILT